MSFLGPTWKSYSISPLQVIVSNSHRSISMQANSTLSGSVPTSRQWLLMCLAKVNLTQSWSSLSAAILITSWHRRLSILSKVRNVTKNLRMKTRTLICESVLRSMTTWTGLPNWCAKKLLKACSYCLLGSISYCSSMKLRCKQALFLSLRHVSVSLPTLCAWSALYYPMECLLEWSRTETTVVRIPATLAHRVARHLFKKYKTRRMITLCSTSSLSPWSWSYVIWLIRSNRIRVCDLLTYSLNQVCWASFEFSKWAWWRTESWCFASSSIRTRAASKKKRSTTLGMMLTLSHQTRCRCLLNFVASHLSKCVCRFSLTRLWEI